MRSRAVLLLLLIGSTACASLASRVEDAQDTFAYHQARYLRLCCSGAETVKKCIGPDHPPSPTVGCIEYGNAINDLADTLSAAEVALEGGFIPKTGQKELKERLAAVETRAKAVK